RLPNQLSRALCSRAQEITFSPMVQSLASRSKHAGTSRHRIQPASSCSAYRMTSTITLPKDRPRKALVRVGLVEDIDDMRQSWSRLISRCQDLECVCACATGEEALRELPACRPDVVLMDIYLPKMSGIECTARVKILLPNTQILILTVAEEHDL